MQASRPIRVTYRWPFVLFGLVACVYLVGLTYFGRFADLDESFFKSPGRNWAATGHFNSPELSGFGEFDPPIEEVWFAYTPLYPFLFGLYTRLVGFGWRQCVFFDAAIHVLLATMTLLLSRRLLSNSRDWLSVLSGLAVLPLGTVARPDELAMSLGMLGLLILLTIGRHCGGVAAAGLIFGLCAAASPGAAVTLGCVAVVLLLLQEEPLQRRIAKLACWGACALVTLSAAIAPILICHPHAYQQFLDHSKWFTGVVTTPHTLSVMWTIGRSYLSVAGALLLAGLLTVRPVVRTLGVTEWLRIWAGPLVALIFLLTYLSGQQKYFWFLGPWMIAATSYSLYAVWPQMGWGLRTSATLLLVMGFLVGAAPFVKQSVTMIAMPDIQRIDAGVARVREVLPPGSKVLADDYWWAMAGREKVYCPMWSGMEAVRQADYVVLTSIHSDAPGVPRRLRIDLIDYVRDNFEPADDNLNREPLRVCGMSLTKGADGFGALVLRRKKLASQLETASVPR